MKCSVSWCKREAGVRVGGVALCVEGPDHPGHLPSWRKDEAQPLDGGAKPQETKQAAEAAAKPKRKTKAKETAPAAAADEFAPAED